MSHVFQQFEAVVRDVVEGLAGEGALPAGIETRRVAVEPPRDPRHGDLATNAALALAKEAGRKPRELAEMIAGRLAKHADVAVAEIAGPGFINLRLGDDYWRRQLAAMLVAG